MFILAALLSSCSHPNKPILFFLPSSAESAPATSNCASWPDAIGYHISTDRFSNGNASNDAPVAGAEVAATYLGGDLAGINAKINDGYFADLGVNLLVVTSPVDGAETAELRPDGHTGAAFEGYWPTTLDKTEPRFGSMDELKAFVENAHNHGIKVIIEYNANHVHDSSPVFIQHAGWFSPPLILGSASMPWDSPQAIRGWVAEYLPDIDYTNPATQAYSLNILQGWLSGVDGVLLLTPNLIDSSFLAAVHDLRSSCSLVVGDYYMNSPTTLLNYTANLDGMKDYPLRAQLVEKVLMRGSTMVDLGTFLLENQSRYGRSMWNFTGSPAFGRSIHFGEDTPLWGNAWADGADRAWSSQPALSAGKAFERLSVVDTILFTIPGIPILFYGDEVGLPGGGNPDSMRAMQWSGYSTAQTALRSRIKGLIAVRKAHPALRRGKLNVLNSSSETLLYSMSSDKEILYIAVNRSDTPVMISGFPSSALTNAIDGSSVSGPAISVPARSALILH